MKCPYKGAGFNHKPGTRTSCPVCGARIVPLVFNKTCFVPAHEQPLAAVTWDYRKLTKGDV